MKTLKLVFLSLSLVSLLISCETNEEQEAERNVSEFSKYVDSVTAETADDLKVNWENIEKEYTEKKLQAQSSVEALGGHPDLNVKLNKANSKYNEFKKSIQFEIDKFQRDAQK